MHEIGELEKRRMEIIREISSIRAMRKGSVTEQYLKVVHKGKTEPALRGPYFLYSRKEKGKTLARRLSKQEVGPFRQGVDAFHRFRALAKEYAEICERMADLAEGSVWEKKPPRSPLNRTGR